jgi:hypothetical protein
MLATPLDYTDRGVVNFFERSRRRMRLQWTLIGVAFALFGIALPLPAMVVDVWHSGQTNADPGWLCLAFGVLFYPSNLYFLLSPLWSAIILHGRTEKGQGIIVTLSAISTMAVIWLFFQSFSDFRIGGYLWVLAHCMATLSFCFTVPRSKRENH